MTRHKQSKGQYLIDAINYVKRHCQPLTNTRFLTKGENETAKNIQSRINSGNLQPSEVFLLTNQVKTLDKAMESNKSAGRIIQNGPAEKGQEVPMRFFRQHDETHIPEPVPERSHIVIVKETLAPERLDEIAKEMQSLYNDRMLWAMGVERGVFNEFNGFFILNGLNKITNENAGRASNLIAAIRPVYNTALQEKEQRAAREMQLRVEDIKKKIGEMARYRGVWESVLSPVAIGYFDAVVKKINGSVELDDTDTRNAEFAIKEIRSILDANIAQPGRRWNIINRGSRQESNVQSEAGENGRMALIHDVRELNEKFDGAMQGGKMPALTRTGVENMDNAELANILEKILELGGDRYPRQTIAEKIVRNETIRGLRNSRWNDNTIAAIKEHLIEYSQNLNNGMSFSDARTSLTASLIPAFL